MSNLPPFEPPYQAISPEFGKSILEFEKIGEQTRASATVNSTTNAKAAGPVTGAKDGVVFLVVPFAEKDEAKALGARWDAANRKWYVPAGKDQGAFKRWMPEE